MKPLMTGLAALLLTTTAAGAGGIDRSGQDTGILFQDGRSVELSFGSVMPDVGGVDVLGNRIGNVADSYTPLSLGFKADISDTLSYAVILDQPFGADVAYGGSSTTTMLGGTTAFAQSTALTGLIRYKVSDSTSVYGGPRIEQANARVHLGGAAYGPVNGYSVDLDQNTAAGYVVGAAYERPDIALRVALTYNSAIRHKFDTTESGPPIDPDGPGPFPLLPLLDGTSITTVNTPQSVNLDFQSGIAANTLIFGRVRWVDWSAFRLDPENFVKVAGDGLIDLSDTTTLTLGVGHKFSDAWSGAVSVSYEKAGDRLISPLAPTTGLFGATVAAVYTVNAMKITTGINYTKLGDADPETGTPDVARAHFTGNSAVGVGIKIGFAF